MPVMTRQISIIRILFRERLRPQEHHVFTKMRTPGQVRWIFQMPYSDVEGCGGLVCLGVGDEDDLELVRKGEEAVRTGLRRG